jgi:AsmA protein
MKWIKRILIGVAVLVLLFVIAAVVLVATFDPNDYKQRIQAAAKQATGRELRLQGDIDLSFFPWLGLKLGAATLGNAPGFGEEPFASVDNVQVRVALLPLFRGEIQADTVRLQGLEVSLRRNAQGATNWDDLLKETDQPAPQEPPGQPGREISFEIGGIVVENAAVRWRDAQAGTDVRIAPIDLSTGAVTLGEPFDLELSLLVKNAEPAITADVDLSGEATLNPKAQRYALSDLQLTVDATGAQLPEDGVEATLNTDVLADLAAGTATVQPLTLEVAGLRLAGQVAASGLNAAPQVQGELVSNAFNPRRLLEALGQALPPTQDPNVLNDAKLELAFNATTDAAKLARLDLQLDDTRVTGEGAVQSFAEPKINFVAALDAIDLNRYQPPESETEPAPEGKPAPPADDSLGLPTDTLRDLNLNGRLSAGRVKASGLTFTDLQATITAQDGVVKINPLGMKLYQGALKGNATLDVRGETPKFALTTALDGVQAGTLLTELAGDDYLTGTTRLTLNLQTQGERISALQQALNGSLQASFKEGSIANSELAGRIARVVAFFRKQPASAAAAGEQTRFTSLTGGAQIVNGILRNNNLALVSPLILARGQGTVNLAQAVMDYTLNIALNDGGEPRGNRFVPIEIGGPLSDLNYNLALTDVVKEEAQQAIQQELKEKEQELRQELQEKQRDLEEGLQDKLQQELKDRFNF